MWEGFGFYRFYSRCVAFSYCCMFLKNKMQLRFKFWMLVMFKFIKCVCRMTLPRSLLSERLNRACAVKLNSHTTLFLLLLRTLSSNYQHKHFYIFIPINIILFYENVLQAIGGWAWNSSRIYRENWCKFFNSKNIF